jgi:hypothetical protein
VTGRNKSYQIQLEPQPDHVIMPRGAAHEPTDPHDLRPVKPVEHGRPSPENVAQKVNFGMRQEAA